MPAVLPAHFVERVGDLAQRADAHGLEQLGEHVAARRRDFLQASQRPGRSLRIACLEAARRLHLGTLLGLAGTEQGRGRVLRQVQALGVDRDTARAAVTDAFTDVDEEALLEGALTRRLRGRPFPTDRKDVARLYAWLVRQGFDADKVSTIIRRLQK